MKFTYKYLLYFGLLPMLCSFSSSEINKKNQYKVKTIVIDPGHGGKDPGTLGGNSREKDIVLKISLELGKTIKKHLPGVKVVYTRTTDKLVGLSKRSEIANNANADLFVSIHCNSIGGSAKSKNRVKGTEVFVMGQHVSDENLAVAMRENSAILMEKDHKKKYQGFDPNSPEGYIMLSLMQNAYLDNSLKLASKINHQLTNRAKRKSRGVKQAGFVVLKETTTPSVLVECGFISNPEEEKYLKDPWGQTVVASAIFRAIRDYKNEIDASGKK